MDNPLGKPQWITRDQLIRFVQNSMGVLAGLFLAAAGLVWGWCSEDSSLPSRVVISSGAIAGGAGLAIGLIRYMERVRDRQT